jgi:GNAT superfamily N-acetyltransferase
MLDDARLRLLTAADVEDAMRLKDAAGWNQTPEDWLAFLELSPRGCFGIEEGGRIVATSTAVSYGPFGWVGMVLVDAERRRLGLGTRLLLEAVRHLEAAGAVPALDATPAGRPVYERQGFVAAGEIHRWVSDAAPLLDDDPACAPVDDARWGDALRLDLDAFGAGRAALLGSMRSRAGGLALVHRGGGFLLARRGSRFLHLGPVIAESAATALALVRAALRRAAGERVGIDVPEAQTALRDGLRSLQFRIERPLIRMVKADRRGAGRGESAWAGGVFPWGRSERVFAIAGPEWG